MVKRCSWVDENSTIYKDYHDHEWGKPVYDDEKLYEMFLLETFQAGLSWITILKKRESFKDSLFLFVFYSSSLLSYILSFFIQTETLPPSQ